MTIIHTQRLDLLALSAAQLQLYLDLPDALERELGLPLSREVITERVQRAIQMKLVKMAQTGEGRGEWYTYWLIVVRVGTPFGAGLIGFKGFPNEEGEAEVGYGIDPACQGQGYTTEALRGLIAWAFEEPACQSVVARDTKKWNVASLRVLAKVGMNVYQESEDAYWLRVQRGNFKGNPPQRREV